MENVLAYHAREAYFKKNDKGDIRMITALYNAHRFRFQISSCISIWYLVYELDD